jgi:hypothetical protein
LELLKISTCCLVARGLLAVAKRLNINKKEIKETFLNILPMVNTDNR